ncbi:hypothetical protein OPV22_034382 [Ensete ventricosum]|uniref:Uncharacterized protein n=1 Tax=Ensete ventricosum TaxID=4639 RepID=A0AAV8P1S3_ENSVE|nr:hypothetical protein OPV22_034382 [Ensete ventricosum]
MDVESFSNLFMLGRRHIQVLTRGTLRCKICLRTTVVWIPSWRDDAIKKNMTVREKRYIRDFSKSYNHVVFQNVVEFFLICMVGAPMKMKQTLEICSYGAFACNPLIL